VYGSAPLHGNVGRKAPHLLDRKFMISHLAHIAPFLAHSTSIAFLIVCSAALFSSKGHAQATGTVLSTGNIVTPIGISHVQSLSFGRLAAGATAGTIVLNAQTGVRTKTGGVTLLTGGQSGTIQYAQFTVTGQGSYTFAITLPEDHELKRSGGGGGTEHLHVVSFTSYPSGAGTLSNGTATLHVGGTLQVVTHATAGTYTSEEGFSVRVNYN
jgi:hypothetical protein